MHTGQTQGAWPLRRAWTLLQARCADRGKDRIDDAALRHAATHRSAFMWPWEEPPHSIASGILDDETYDWLAVLRGMAHSGGSAVVADEAALQRSHRLALGTTGIAVSPTAAAGLAGLLQLQGEGRIARGARVGLLFTGVQR